MLDQANDLRQLVRQCASPPAMVASSRPCHVVVCGGKGGVGTTTLSVSLAVVLGGQGVPTVLIDAAGGADSGMLCRAEPKFTLADVLAGTRTVAQVLTPGPGPIDILPGCRRPEFMAEESMAAWDRLLGQLAVLGSRASVVVVDAGNRPDRMARRFWQAADRILMVTTSETAALTDTYFSIKALVEPGRTAPIYLLVNAEARAETAAEVFHRLERVCRRFLATRLREAGHVPPDARLRQWSALGERFARTDPNHWANRSVCRLAQTLALNPARAGEAA